MAQYTSGKTSVFWSMIGLGLLMFSFIGLVSIHYSSSDIRIDGNKVVELSQIEQISKPQTINALCSVDTDEPYIMPDNNQKVIKGRIMLSAIFNDGSQQILYNQQGSAANLKLKDKNQDNYNLEIMEENISTVIDTVGLNKYIKIDTSSRNIKISYFDLNFKLSKTLKGVPKVKLMRKTLKAQDTVILEVDAPYKFKNNNIEAYQMQSYSNAKKKQPTFSGLEIICIVLIVIGIVLFFVPESQNKSTKLIPNFLSKKITNR